MTGQPAAGRLAAIRARAEAATPGPWERAPLDRNDRERDDFLGHALEGPPEAERAAFALRADAEFAAHAREDVPWLLDRLEQARANVATLKDTMGRTALLLAEVTQVSLDDAQRAEKAEAERDEAQAALERVRELHQPDPNVRAGWKSDADPAAYGRIAQACTQCGAVDLAVRWPCPTIQAVDAEQPAGEVSR